MRRGFAFVLRLVLGGLFIYAGAAKVADAQDFAVAITNYRIVSWDIAVVAALYLPWIEIVAGAGVVLRRLYGGSLVVLIGLLLVFVVATVSAAVRGLNITCGCFGSDGSIEPAWRILLRDGVVMSGLLVLAWSERRHSSCINRSLED